MFRKLAKKLDGVLDYIAPREESDDTSEQESNPSNTRRRRRPDSMSDEQVTSDAAFAKQLQIEEERKEKLLKTQFEDESNALNHGHFCKRQRVMYHLKSKDAFYEAVIVGVHYDDGPNQPYYVRFILSIAFFVYDHDCYTLLISMTNTLYHRHVQTIRYKTTETCTDEQGKTFTQEMDVEKQTTPDRLSPLPWDEEKTWLNIGGR